MVEDLLLLVHLVTVLTVTEKQPILTIGPIHGNDYLERLLNR